MRADRWSDFFSGLQWNALLCSQGLYEHAASVVDISTSVFAAFLVVMASDWRNHLRDQDLSWFTVWNSPPCWGNCDDWSLRQLDLLTFPSGCWHYRQDVTCTWHLYRVLRSQTPPWQVLFPLSLLLPQLPLYTHYSTVSCAVSEAVTSGSPLWKSVQEIWQNPLCSAAQKQKQIQKHWNS